MSTFKDVLEKNRGYEAFKEKEAEIESRMAGKVYRFWLPDQKEAKIIFLDDDPPIIEEHQLKLNGSWQNYFTCRRVIGEPCIICDELKNAPYTVGFYTILDLSEFTNKKGESIKNTIKIFAPKFKALQVIKRHSQKRKGLALWVCDIYRSGPDAWNVGDVFEFEKKLESWDVIKELNPDAAVVDYAELLAPKTNEELRRILSGNTENLANSNLNIAMDEKEVDF